MAANDPGLAPALWKYPVARARLAEALAPLNLDPSVQRKLDPLALLALAAARSAQAEAGWLPGVEGAPVAVVLGVGYGPSQSLMAAGRRLARGQVERLSPFTLPASMPNAAAAQVALAGGFRGPAWTVGTGCASGLDALHVACLLLRAGTAGRALAGGVEWVVDDLGVGGMAAARGLAPLGPEGDPAVVLPFGLRRSGTAVASGGALFALERESDARARGVAILGLIEGCGSSSDAHHITAPDPSGRGAEAAMVAALRSAGRHPGEVEAVYAHGTGTARNDLMEGQALVRLFGERLPPLTSVKGQCGHTMGASGAVNLAFALETLAQGLLPATRPTLEVDPQCGVRPVMGDPERRPFSLALVNAFGFGGHNASLLVRRDSH